MIRPNYKNSIVNLASSILASFDKQPLYKKLDELNDIKKYDNLILLAIDGLGSEYLRKYGKDSFLQKHFVKDLTSVFPSTTASAMTSLSTAVAPQQHGITGWFMYLRELGTVTTILPFCPRHGGSAFKIKKSDIFIEKDIVNKISQPAFKILPANIAKKERYRQVKGYYSLNGMFKQISRAINSSKQGKYIDAYWPEFDHLCHTEGCKSKKVKDHFWKLDQKIANFAKTLKRNNATLIITADHGLIDTPKTNLIALKEHPKLAETLSLPLCGEPRAVYCYVRPDKVRQFKNYIKQNLNHCCTLYKSSDLIKRNFFGLYKVNPKLEERIGDYTLIMKENYIMQDFLLGEPEEILKANHGGLSKEEMLVPLILVD